VVVLTRGSLARPYRWLPVLLVSCALLACEDLPPDTGVGTISGTITYFGNKTDSNNPNRLGSPWLMILASYEPFDPSIMFQATLMVPCKDFPEGGIPYELKGLAPEYSYYVYAGIADWSREDWWTVFSLGAYRDLFNQEHILLGKDPGPTNDAGARNIDFTLIDLF
jgi:hypothetical protein